MTKRMIITLCGSTRFKEQFDATNKELTLEGHVVLSYGCWGKHNPDPRIEMKKELLDQVHKVKIAMSDAIYVINLGGYIGKSTRSEIAYALEHGKEVHFLEGAFEIEEGE